MDFLKAVFMAVLIYILAPLAVRYVELNFLLDSVHATQTAEGERQHSGLNR